MADERRWGPASSPAPANAIADDSFCPRAPRRLFLRSRALIAASARCRVSYASSASARAT